MTRLSDTDRARSLLGMRDAFEGVARWPWMASGMGTDDAHSTSTNQSHHSPQRVVEKVRRSITNSETPQYLPPPAERGIVGRDRVRQRSVGARRSRTAPEPRRTALACAALTKRVLLIAVMALGVVPASAAAALPVFRGSLITPGRSVAGVSIGQSSAKAIRSWGLNNTCQPLTGLMQCVWTSSNGKLGTVTLDFHNGKVDSSASSSAPTAAETRCSEAR